MSDTTLFHDSAYIDPTECDSQVSYKINLTEDEQKDGSIKKRINAYILLSDCSRKIDWYFGNEERYL